MSLAYVPFFLLLGTCTIMIGHCFDASDPKVLKAYFDYMRGIERAYVSPVFRSVASVGTEVHQRQQCLSLQTNGLNRRQIKVCRKNMEHMESVKIGALMAIEECQYQFKYRRWNCTPIKPEDIAGTREAAYIHSISSSAVSHSVTKDCSSGRLQRCGCDSSHYNQKDAEKRGFVWSGCSDNVHYGIAFGRQFVDAHEKGKKVQPMSQMQMNLHNNKAGRLMLLKKMSIQCKCHGVSGSCEVKTCWRALPKFRQIGNILMDKFHGATEVKFQPSNYREPLVPIYPDHKRPAKEDLVYLKKSPDFCERDEEFGTLGTHGRSCNKTSPGIDGCDLLCCHRGFQTQLEIKEEMCKCKFHWCCYVRCKKCHVQQEISSCL